MIRMFTWARAFNGDLKDWDVSNVTDMSSMFYDARAFNGDLSRWNVRNVTSMEFMFHGTRAFNGDLRGWNVRNVTNMSYMFAEAAAFNGDPIHADTCSLLCACVASWLRVGCELVLPHERWRVRGVNYACLPITGHKAVCVLVGSRWRLVVN